MWPEQALPGVFTFWKGLLQTCPHMKCSDTLLMPTAFEHEAARKTQCKVHIFDPTLSLGKQQELGRVKEFSFHNVGLTGEGIKVQLQARWACLLVQCMTELIYSAAVNSCRAHMRIHAQHLRACSPS